MKYILLVIWCLIPYLLFPLGVFAAVLLVRHFILKRMQKRNSSEDARFIRQIGTLNAIMITAVGLTVVRAVRDYVYFIILRPDRYALTSFPWYTNSLLYGAGALVVLVVCLIIKLIIKHKAKKAQ